MQRVTFTYKNGRERAMSVRDAGLMERLGKGTYMTCDMRVAHSESSAATSAGAAVSAYDLDEMNADALHALAKERGIKIHHKTGIDKVRAAIREGEK